MAAKRKKAKTVGRVVPYAGPRPAAQTGVQSLLGRLTPVDPAAVRPPAGTYDPMLDAGLAASKRGYGDMQFDFSRDYGSNGAGGRAFNDYQIGLEGLTRSRDRGLADIGTGEARALQDRDTSLGNIGRAFQQLGGRQTAAAAAAGAARGGALQQGMAKRAVNQDLERAPVLTAFDRQKADFTTSRARVGEDFTSQSGALGLGYQRAGEDAITGLGRAGREVGQFGIDTQAARLFQATQAGYQPPVAAPAPAGSRKRSKRRGGRARATGPNTAAGMGSF